MNRKFLILLIKGIPIGISNVLPGISGGTIALILNIYEELVEALKKFDFRKLLPVVLGIGTGILSTAKAVNFLMQNYPDFMLSLLFGMILASAWYTRQTIDKISISGAIGFIAGIIAAIAVAFWGADNVNANGDLSIVRVGVGGFFAAMSMLLPGISGATVLVMMGLYTVVIEALTEFNFVILGVFGMAAAAGIIMLSWVLSYVLREYRNTLMAILTGLIIGSAAAVIPDKLGFIQAVAGILGIVIVLLLSKSGGKL